MDAELAKFLAAGPVEIDLGCHRGRFVVAMAEVYPETRFLGIERQAGRVLRGQAKLTRLGLANARIIAGEGLEMLRDTLPASVASVIHVSFPDPWPKRRHWDRRLVNVDFLHAAARALAPGGTLRLMTDDAPYFRAMEVTVAGEPGWTPVPWEDGRVYPETEFQKKFVATGQPIYRLALRRGAAIASA